MTLIVMATIPPVSEVGYVCKRINGEHSASFNPKYHTRNEIMNLKFLARKQCFDDDELLKIEYHFDAEHPYTMDGDMFREIQSHLNVIKCHSCKLKIAALPHIFHEGIGRRKSPTDKSPKK